MQQIDPVGDGEASKRPNSLFVWRGLEPGNTGRTALSLKAKPHTPQKAAEAMMGSRHGWAGLNEGLNDGDRRAFAHGGTLRRLPPAQ